VAQDPAFITKRMSAVHPSGGKADQALGKSLWKRGMRYRRRSSVLGRPDLVFHSARVVVFVDGDFWHGRWLDERIARGDFKSNADYWIPKLRRNAERDCEITRLLSEDGWLVIRVWESDVKKHLEQTTELIAGQIQARLTPGPPSESQSTNGNRVA
jgi:DNA mismatch endonuclease, patch repair protein